MNRRCRRWLCLAILAAPLSAAGQESFGTLAVGAGLGYGATVDYPTQAEADTAALNECRARDEGCEIVDRFGEGMCFAFAVSEPAEVLGWAVAPDLQQARTGARQHCVDAGGGRGCMVTESDCNGNSADLATATPGASTASASGPAPALRAATTPPPSQARQPGDTFFDPLSSGGRGPEMVVIPAGRFRMGCVSGQGCRDREFPVHDVTIPRAFAVSKHEVTFEEYDRYTRPNRVDDEGWGRGRRPAVNVSWNNARDYVEWLSAQTGHAYRLLSEAEWEYVARAGSSTAYSWGNGIGSSRANCDGCGSQWDDDRTAPVGSFAANAFGVHDMHGNVWEWVEDCWNGTYAGAPSDGSAWRSGDCERRVLRGGSWNYNPGHLRSAIRIRNSTGFRYLSFGFRVARTLTP